MRPSRPAASVWPPTTPCSSVSRGKRAPSSRNRGYFVKIIVLPVITLFFVFGLLRSFVGEAI